MNRVGLFVRRFSLFVALATATVASSQEGVSGELNLNGLWEVGTDRSYSREVSVPGLAQDPGEMSSATLWYRRNVRLPEGRWKRASLELKGARFAPRVFVDGREVSTAQGGMAPTVHELRSESVKPGKTIRLEIALESLQDLDPEDASVIPVADRWRSNVSSGLWDDVILRFSGDTKIDRIIPWTHFSESRLDVHWELDRQRANDSSVSLEARVLDLEGKLVAKSEKVSVDGLKGISSIELADLCKPWSPFDPTLYKLEVIVRGKKGNTLDRRSITWAFKEFKVDGLGFSLNKQPVHLRAGTVVWHRFLRDPEGASLGFDEDWFRTEIVERLRGMGANTLRFHLGLPPERLLDMCDEYGLMVQLEWSFFHGIKASPESMRVQWKSWLDVAMRHPSVVLVHPWNETGGEELEKANSALDAILGDYPKLVISHRDVIHIHKYWWSLFENLGLYYDSPEEFGQPIMVDEFGGNYLDANGDIGGYRALKQSFPRFLGRGHTREQRLRFQAEANGRVAEYWRRLGAAGFSPFCILGSPRDGNHWFLGSLKDPKLKPVWGQLSAAYSPLSVSLEVWNRNFEPREEVELPVYLFNEYDDARKIEVEVRIVARGEREQEAFEPTAFSALVPAHSSRRFSVRMLMPDSVGEWRFEAEVQNSPAEIENRVISTWDCRTLRTDVSVVLLATTVAVPGEETELRELLARHEVKTAGVESTDAKVIALAAKSWRRLIEDEVFREKIELAHRNGSSIVLLDVGPQDLGYAYNRVGVGSLDKAPVLTEAEVESHELFSGLRFNFRQVAEPESHLHPALENDDLWNGLPLESTWLWNGLRGGLIAPATEMEVYGLSSSAFLTFWTNRGAEESAIVSGQHYYAHQLAGYYAFSVEKDDKETIAKLREHVSFIVEDAPSLEDRVNPNAPIETVDLAEIYRETKDSGAANELTPLASCGKNLSRIPVVSVSYGEGMGDIVISQLLTEGRLKPNSDPLRVYELGHDPSAEQFVLNLLSLAAERK